MAVPGQPPGATYLILLPFYGAQLICGKHMISTTSVPHMHLTYFQPVQKLAWLRSLGLARAARHGSSA